MPFFYFGSFLSLEDYTSFTSSQYIKYPVCEVVMYFVSSIRPRSLYAYFADIDKDEQFYPSRDVPNSSSLIQKHIPYFGVFIAWICYLFIGFTLERGTNHFNPFSRKFIGHEWECALSITCVSIMCACLYQV